MISENIRSKEWVQQAIRQAYFLWVLKVQAKTLKSPMQKPRIWTFYLEVGAIELSELQVHAPHVHTQKLIGSIGITPEVDLDQCYSNGGANGNL